MPMILVSVTQEQLSNLEESGICEQLLTLDNVKEVCFDDWYGPYIYCMVHHDDDQTLHRVSELVEKFLEDGCNQQQKTFLFNQKPKNAP